MAKRVWEWLGKSVVWDRLRIKGVTVGGAVLLSVRNI